MAEVTQDLFMQWYPIEITTDGSASQTVVEEQFTTGLSIRGNYAWLIHCVEFYFDPVHSITASNVLIMCLSTVQGSATLPVLNAAGLICRLNLFFNHDTEGSAFSNSADARWTSLPPTIIASPKLSLYAGTGSDLAALRGQSWYGRIGYTTVPMDDRTYLEIAETFETL